MTGGRERQQSVAAAEGERRRVWDLPLRLAHWGLTLAVTGSFVTHWAGDAAFRAHVVCGCTALVIVAFRIAWGFVGPAHARFADFVRGPRAVLASLTALRRGAYRRAVGHTPAGGWMVRALLGLVALQAGLGLFANDEVTNSGPLYGYVGQHLSDRLSAWHARLANLILGAVVLHVVAALYYRLALRDDLVGPLITGYKRGVPAAAAIGSQHIGRAALIVLVLIALLAWLLATAPEAPLVLM